MWSTLKFTLAAALLVVALAGCATTGSKSSVARYNPADVQQSEEFVVNDADRPCGFCGPWPF